MTEKTYQRPDDDDDNDDDLTTPDVEFEAEEAEADDPAEIPADEVDNPDRRP